LGKKKKKNAEVTENTYQLGGFTKGAGEVD